MHNSCDIVYELPTSKHDQKKNICNVVMCILVFLIFWNTMSQPHVIYREKIPEMVSSMAASLLGSDDSEEVDLPTADETSVSTKIEDLEKTDLPLSADAENSKDDPDATANQTEDDKKLLSEKVDTILKKSKKIIVMFWAPWCPHCHSAMRPFVLASQMSPNTKFLMVNAEAVDKEKLFKGENPVVPLTHFPYICRMEEGKMVKLHDSAPTPTNIVENLVPEEESKVEESEPNPLDALFS